MCARHIFSNLNGLIAIGVNDGLLGAEVAFALKYELIFDVANFDVLGEVVHVADDLLEVHGRHSYDGFKVHVDWRKGKRIDVEHSQLEGRAQVLIGVFDSNPEIVGVIFSDVKGQNVVVRDCFDENMKF